MPLSCSGVCSSVCSGTCSGSWTGAGSAICTGAGSAICPGTDINNLCLCFASDRWLVWQAQQAQFQQLYLHMKLLVSMQSLQVKDT